jgi:hypothetical protein
VSHGDTRVVKNLLQVAIYTSNNGREAPPLVRSRLYPSGVARSQLFRRCSRARRLVAGLIYTSNNCRGAAPPVRSYLPL